MKQINVTYEDKTFSIIEQLKKRKKLNWHDFILFLVMNELKQEKEMKGGVKDNGSNSG